MGDTPLNDAGPAYACSRCVTPVAHFTVSRSSLDASRIVASIQTNEFLTLAQGTHNTRSTLLNCPFLRSTIDSLPLPPSVPLCVVPSVAFLFSRFFRYRWRTFAHLCCLRLYPFPPCPRPSFPHLPSPTGSPSLSSLLLTDGPLNHLPSRRGYPLPATLLTREFPFRANYFVSFPNQSAEQVPFADYRELASEFQVVSKLGTGAVVYLIREVLSRSPPSEDDHVYTRSPRA
jgi:hypothetical protein